MTSNKSSHLQCLYVFLAILSTVPNTAAWCPARNTKNCRSRSIAATESTTLLSMTATRGPRVGRRNESPREEQEDFAFSNILEDGHGHVNSDLAAVLWNWEQQHREMAKLPKLSFSTRQGLRLVDDIVRSIVESPRGRKVMQGNDDTMRTDLAQEGVMALMDALNDYRQSTNLDDDSESGSKTLADHNQRFEAYAKPYLEKRLWATLDQTSLPQNANLWKRLQNVRPQLRNELGRNPTLQELSARLELPTETLQLLLAAKRGALSMESTVEIKNRHSLEDTSAHFTDQEEWDFREGHLLDTGEKVVDEVLVEEYQDEMYEYEGDDQMWIHQTQIAAPLRDIIPDDSDPLPDDAALSDMIRQNVLGDFLTKTLTEQEVQVVRMSFGLDSGEPLNWGEISKALALDQDQVKEVLKCAIEKLRTTYQDKYVESFIDLEDEEYFGEDSV